MDEDPGIFTCLIWIGFFFIICCNIEFFLNDRYFENFYVFDDFFFVAGN